MRVHVGPIKSPKELENMKQPDHAEEPSKSTIKMEMSIYMSRHVYIKI